MRRLTLLLSTALPVLIVLLQVSPAFAGIQVDVTNNGADSSNSVSVDSSNTTSTNQSNDANVSNEVSQEGNTGDNEASGNTGDSTQITTGDVNSSTTTSNNLNNSVIDATCCSSSIDITVSSNARGSVNTVHTNLTNTTTVNVSQVANVDNSIDITGNTGKNKASNNLGGVGINTGSIAGSGNLTNVINQTSLVVGPGAWDITIIAKDNGSDSVNVIFLDFLNDFALWKNDIANIKTHVYADLNTGRNAALGNLNDVLVNTGDIAFSFDVINDPINENLAEVICCEDGEPVTPPAEEPPQPAVPPPVNGGPSNGGNGHGGNGLAKAGEVLGGALVDVLPVTGAAALHFWTLAVIYLITFLAGLYLRLRAGRSPDIRLRITLAY